MKEYPAVAIIILNWNGWEDTIECLESLCQITYPAYHIIIVDNGSEDESIEKIRQYCAGEIEIHSKFVTFSHNRKPIMTIIHKREDVERGKSTGEKYFPSGNEITVILNERNYGYAEGNNVGIRYALKILEPKYILLLNNDTVADPKFLSELVDFTERDETIGVVGPEIFYYDWKGSSNAIWFMGGKIDWKKYPGYYHLVNIPQHSTEPIECDWITGAALLMRVGNAPLPYLNTHFFMGCEDVDLCIRFRERGYKIAAVPTSQVWHKVSASRKKRHKDLVRGWLQDTITNLRFLKMYNNRFYHFLPLYVLQLIIHAHRGRTRIFS